jgi:uncharacterized protein
MNMPGTSLPTFRPRLPWYGSDLQTIRNAVMKDHADLTMWPGTRKTFEAVNGDCLCGVLHRALNSQNKLVVLVHGLTGCEDSAYVRASAHHLLADGFDVFRFNMRGAGPSRAECRTMYHAGRTEDLDLALRELLRLGLGMGGIFAMGYSLGGNQLLKYLGETGRDALVARAISVSAPLDLAAASARLEDSRNRIYHRWLLDRMKQDWQAGPLDIAVGQREALEAAPTIRAFDDGVVAPLNGFSGAADYYARNTSGQFLSQIGVPTLLLHGNDDPWIPVASYRNPGALPDHVRIEIAHGGGHVGFHGKNGRWHDQCASLFFRC